MRPAQKEIMGPPGLQCGPQGQAGVSITAAPTLQPRGTSWPGQLQGEPHPGHLSRLPISVLLVSASHLMILCLAAPSDTLKTEHSACDDKIKAGFSSESLAVQHSAG